MKGVRLIQNWGMELCMAALLAAAFLFLNALSLVFLAAVGVGMAASEGVRRHVWRLLVLPLLGLLLLEQYRCCHFCSCDVSAIACMRSLWHKGVHAQAAIEPRVWYQSVCFRAQATLFRFLCGAAWSWACHRGSTGRHLRGC